MCPHKKRILCVEDDTDISEMISSLLGLFDCEVVSAQSFDDAWQKVLEGNFDLYLLDNWLPGGSGIQLCTKIRDVDKKTPIIFYSGAAYASDQEAALEAGAQAYLVKPVDISKLVQTIKTFLPIP